jgi:Protein of unknown function (DUF3800)
VFERRSRDGAQSSARLPDEQRADVAQLVAHHLAKVRVAGSSPVVRSTPLWVPLRAGARLSYVDHMEPPSGPISSPKASGMMLSVPGRRLLRVYVDETGDRGASRKASPFFAFAAVLVADEKEQQLREAVRKLRNDFQVPDNKALHWNRHVKKFARRQHTAKTLCQLTEVKVCYVVEKAAIPAGSGMLSNQVLFYNYAAGLVLERAVLDARNWPGGSRDALIRFGHVRGFNHSTTRDYFALKQKLPATAPLPWSCLRSVHFDDQASWDGLQAADQYAGMLYAAFQADEFGGYESVHLLSIRHQLRRNGSGNAWGWGFKLLGNAASATSLDWWPSAGL